ncbi:carbamoyltransferase HypF [Dyadobacter frigoris]|uniref:Carbamoyltransferase n=1 Tax=Dyadobacter frigoris TaxID=2576211 RepID=A0A4U6CVD6_9BACT|nr:carbamoyltransferase HypF [Dyadobacter frigoris]
MKNDISTTFSIKLNGLVQGIGFRPYVFQLAKKWNLKGTVSNGPSGVHIQILANEKIANDFLEEIISNPPALSRIVSHELTENAFTNFSHFEIIESKTEQSGASTLLTPDLAMCENCRQELQDPDNRRFRYPFITCTHCGPRYSIIQKLPYDRVNSSMQDFDMCPECHDEFENPENRRFYSQTNSCKSCGPRLFWYESKLSKSEQVLIDNQDAILTAVKDALTKGKILAVKGIGGYLLLCDAANEMAVKTLRERKHRPSKPFAILYPDIEKLRHDTYVTDCESEHLQSPVSPVVLVKRKEISRFSIDESVAPGLDHLGVMLPYSPLLAIIASDFRKPLVATSGNISNSPIIFQDKKALEELVGIADFILTNNREIVTPQDDSVIRFSALHQKKIILRRSRGMSPDLAISQKTSPFPSQKIAFGASAKSTFCIQNGNEKYISQYHGDLENYDTQESFRHSLNHLTTIFGLSPATHGNFAMLLSDMHPGYFSTLLADEYAAKFHAKVTKIQHHQAHFAAVLAENDLAEDSENVLGVIWDGTGYGTDGMIWGGEFFYQNQRLHFPYFDSLLGDKMAKEPRLSALAVLSAFSKEPLPRFLENKFTNTEWTYLQKVIGSNTLKTSSIGRLFDAVASLTGLTDKTSFEGEAALLLEQEAQRYFDANGYDFPENYFDKAEFLIDELIADIHKEKQTGWIAAKFHYSVVKFAEHTAVQLGAKKLAFSGGVFQNTLLTDLFIENLSGKFDLYFHGQLSPNDENISLGQLAYINAVKV